MCYLFLDFFLMKHQTVLSGHYVKLMFSVKVDRITMHKTLGLLTY